MGQLGRRERFDDAAVNALTDTWRGWNCGGKRVPAPGKYQKPLGLTDHEQFGKRQCPYQDAHLVTQLRNTLVHYRPELVTLWVPDIQEVTRQVIEKKLRPKISPRILYQKMGTNSPFPTGEQELELP
ncbi:MAG: hypothetical protein H5U02_10770 [Clostridia bacterium]|nr:hypothetical protein [Clostridia bacterium]